MVKPEWELLSRLLLLWNGNFKSRFYENDSLLACTWNPQTTFRTWITFLLFLNILKNQRCTFKLSGLTWYVYLKQHCLKVSIFGVFLVRISRIGLNTDIYRVNFCIQFKYGKILTKKTQNMDNFYEMKERNEFISL